LLDNNLFAWMLFRVSRYAHTSLIFRVIWVIALQFKVEIQNFKAE